MFGTNDESPDFRDWSRRKLQLSWETAQIDGAMETGRLAIAGAVIFIIVGGGIFTACTGGPDNTAGIIDLATGSTNCRVVTTEEGDTIQSAAAKAIAQMGVDPTKVTGLDERAQQAEQFGGSARIGRKVEACMGDDTKVTQVNVR